MAEEMQAELAQQLKESQYVEQFSELPVVIRAVNKKH
jgi:hypothetical protein